LLVRSLYGTFSSAQRQPLDISSHALIARPRLTELLSRAGLHHSLTLVSAPAGFGKTTLLAAWMQLRLFAEGLHYRLQRLEGAQVATLHLRASH
jgi:ATP/maltotriose-dependent transcriptional regulator MalT